MSVRFRLGYPVPMTLLAQAKFFRDHAIDSHCYLHGIFGKRNKIFEVNMEPLANSIFVTIDFSYAIYKCTIYDTSIVYVYISYFDKKAKQRTVTLVTKHLNSKSFIKIFFHFL